MKLEYEAYPDMAGDINMKTILIIHHVSALGGGTNSLIDMALMLKKKYRTIICVPSGSADIRKIAESQGIEVYETKTPIPSFNLYSGMPGFFNRYFWSRLFRFRNNKQLVKELLQFNPDAVFFNTSVPALIAKDLPKGIKKICIVRETFIKSPLNIVIKQNFEKRFDGLAFIAELEKKYLNANVPEQVIIPDCLKPKAYVELDKMEMRAKYEIPKNIFCSLFMGGMIKIKGLDVMLKATERLDNNYVTIVAGKIDKSVFRIKYILTHFHNISYVRFIIAVKNRLKKLEKEGKVIETGYVNDIAPYMAMCDTVVFPSTSAHQPRPCIEAGYFKRSCVISDYDATREYFQNDYNSVTFKPGNSKELAEKIMYLSMNPDLNKRLGENNHKMSVEKHNFEKTQEELKMFFERVLKE